MCLVFLNNLWMNRRVAADRCGLSWRQHQMWNFHKKYPLTQRGEIRQFVRADGLATRFSG